jgi:hypothetical protein
MHPGGTGEVSAAALGLEGLGAVDTATKVPAGASKAEAQSTMLQYALLGSMDVGVCIFWALDGSYPALGGDLGKNEILHKGPRYDGGSLSGHTRGHACPWGKEYS